MTTTVIIEKQNPTSKKDDGVMRRYEIEGPRSESVVSFWDWLVERGIIESFEIVEA